LLNKSEKCIIVGPSGSGKDYLMRKLIKEGLKGGIKMTTRPMRINEIQNVTYNFSNFEDFQENLNRDNLICYQRFEVTPLNKSPEIWYYGITKEEFDNSQVFIMTPGEISQIDSDIRKKCFVVYLDIDRKTRENRILKRNDNNDSVLRRLDSDELDFRSFIDYDLKITDPEFTATEVLNLMD
jgi:guanylate kinase